MLILGPVRLQGIELSAYSLGVTEGELVDIGKNFVEYFQNVFFTVKRAVYMSEKFEMVPIEIDRLQGQVL